ncbi:hypothetical protein Pcinc_016328 [Petrolisthes cinctipes]|uniref:Uncharacterized protein n=1 Tax=Petrolisthes cinctipes TaxID=88211 RepID=A0AAE1FR89_PETCI|nr:hypothetical protein Pcinc_016328 [Petrolisthes cinctipes]
MNRKPGKSTVAERKRRGENEYVRGREVEGEEEEEFRGRGEPEIPNAYSSGTFPVSLNHAPNPRHTHYLERTQPSNQPVHATCTPYLERTQPNNQSTSHTLP